MRNARGIAAFAYACLVWASAGWARLPVDWLRRHNLLRIALGLLAATAVAAFLGMLRRRGRPAVWRVLLLAALGAVYWAALLRWAGTHEERIHFPEYGLAAILFARALAPRLRNRGFLFAAAAALGAAAGVIDELFQWITPGRFCDTHDMAINAAAALLGLTAYTAAGGEAFDGAQAGLGESLTPATPAGSRMKPGEDEP